MKNRLVKDSFLILLTNGITYLATIVNTRIISSTFTLTDYGYRAQILSIVAILVAIFSLGFANCPNYFIPIAESHGKNDAVKIVRNLYLVTFFVCLLMSGIVLFNYTYIVDYYKNEELFGYKMIIVFMVIEQIYYSFYSGIQIAQHHAIRATFINLLRAITTIGATSLVCIYDPNIYLIILCTLIVDSAFCLFTMVNSAHPFQRIGKWVDRELIKKMAIYCIPLGISSITSGLCAQIDKLFVARFYSPDDLAVYSNMCTELPLAAISGAFIAVISPYIVLFIEKNNPKKAIELWGYVVDFVSIILFTIIAGLFTFSKQAILILYSEKYVFGYELFQVFILVEVARITYFGLILRSYGKSMLILFCSALTLFLDFVLNSISYFVFHGGLLGFAIATMISTFSIQLLQLIMSCKVSKIKFSAIFPWKNLGLNALVNIGFIICFSFITKILGIGQANDLFNFIPLFMIWAGLYFIIMRRRLTSLHTKIRQVELTI